MPPVESCCHTAARVSKCLCASPLLRKEFVLDRYQLAEARVAGADAVLLIAAAIGAERCHTLAREAHDMGLEVLLEIHRRE